MASPEDRPHLARVSAIALGVVALTVLVAGVLLSRSNQGDVAITPPVGATTPTSVTPPTVSVAGTATPIAPATTAPITTSATTTTTVPVTTTSTSSTTVPAEPAFMVPVAPGVNASWNEGHGANYKAADIFTACDAQAVSPTNGVLLEVRRVNSYDPNVDNPATRGGRSIAILGDDGVRYYMAHFETIADGLEPGQRVAIGQPLATVGQTGRASACHIHFGLSPDCSGPNHDGKEWSVRRGAIWPQPYLDAWRDGEMKSPRAEIDTWVAANPNACAEALADPNAPDA